MQPLMDNLEAQTYETFEKDTTKYIQVLLHLVNYMLNNSFDIFFIFLKSFMWYGILSLLVPKGNF